MRKELKKEFESRGCKIEDQYRKTISNIPKESRKVIQHILEENGYEINENWSTETTIHYQATQKLFKQIAENYDLTEFFQAVEFWGEIAHQKECAMMGCGAELSISHSDSGFHFALDFKNHKIKTLHFGDERVIETYDGKECFIDEMQCSDAEKLILEAIWQLHEETEQIRLLPSNKASKKVVEYRKILKKWEKFLSTLSEEWKGSTFVFGKIYSLQRDIEFWEDHIRKEANKLCL